MAHPSRLVWLIAAALAAQKHPELNDGHPHGDPPYLLEGGWTALFNRENLNGWYAQDGKPNAWFVTKAVRYEPVLSPAKLFAVPSGGGRVVNGPNGRTANLVTEQKLGDTELYLEFMVPKGSNSGVYLHGLYEIQILDSFGTAGPTATSDCGAVYHRWIDGKPVGGSPPRINASRPPGEWQSFQIWFRAPRFDAGKKIGNARFLRVLHNSQLVQENVEVAGPTRAHMNHAEAPLNPLMLQGDHGPAAYRHVFVRPLRAIVTRQ